MNRRTFVKSATTALAASTVFPLFTVGKAGKSANSKLNLAFIGTGNIAEQAYGGLPDENWVALYDVDVSFIAQAKEKYSQAVQAKAFEDFRVMFDKIGKEIDGVCVSTHTRFLDERSNHPRLVNRAEMVQFAKSGYMPEVYDRCPVDNPFAEWGLSLKGEWKQPGSSYDYSAKLTEIALLGVLAQRFGGVIEWDAKEAKVKNRPHLNQYLKEPVRPGWEIGEKYGLHV
jgi:hypothetical protein